VKKIRLRWKEVQLRFYGAMEGKKFPMGDPPKHDGGYPDPARCLLFLGINPLRRASEDTATVLVEVLGH